MVTLITHRVWQQITAAAAASNKPAHVAVAYFGRQGDTLLPLPPGSFLVVDASLPTIEAGSTNPRALDRLRRRGTSIYAARYLHAKVYAFDDVAFVGSANASHHSDATLTEAVLQIKAPPVISSVRDFVQSLCVTELTSADLNDLQRHYRPPRRPRTPVQQQRAATLLMELTREQGLGRDTQVQPPKPVWESYFGIQVGREAPPTLTLINESDHPPTVIRRSVVSHHHNYTIEMAGAGLPLPAILQMRRVGRNRYSYRVHRATDPTFASVTALLQTHPNLILFGTREESG